MLILVRTTLDFLSVFSTFSIAVIILQDEEELADATSQFEEFILQLMDRLFSYIESTAQEDVRIENNIADERSRVEKHILSSMSVSCSTIFGQLSYPIFMVRKN